MTETAEEFIERKNREWPGKPIPTKDIGRRGRLYWKRVAWTFRPQHTAKVFSVERLVLVDEEGERAYDHGAQLGSEEYRIAYWMLSPKTGRWTWGQYCPMIPVADLEPLLDQARAEGTIV